MAKGRGGRDRTGNNGARWVKGGNSRAGGGLGLGYGMERIGIFWQFYHMITQFFKGDSIWTLKVSLQPYF